MSQLPPSMLIFGALSLVFAVSSWRNFRESTQSTQRGKHSLRLAVVFLLVVLFQIVTWFWRAQ